MPAADSRPILQLAVARGLLTAAEAAPLVDLPSSALVQRGLLARAELDLLRNLAAQLESARTEIQRRADSGSISRRAARRASELLDDSARAQPISADAAVAQAQAEPLPSRLFNRYDVLDELGRGGMGVVYKVRDSLLGRTVALKVLPPGDPDGASRFQREARLVARLTHPNIVGLHEFGQDGDVRYFTMPFIDGSTLHHERRTRGADFRFFAERIAEAADALAYAHAQGVLHRDVKPANILIDSTGRAFLADFGLATAPTDFTRLTMAGTILGTPAYMAPEQAKPVHGQALDARADVYALGATLYYALTGLDPHAGANAFEVVDAVLTKDPVRPGRVEANVPRELDLICAKAMAKERERRYATAAEMEDDLRRWLRGEGIHARRLSWTVRLRRRVRRNPWAWGAAVVVAALLVGVPGVRFVRSRYELHIAREEESAQRWEEALGHYERSWTLLPGAAAREGAGRARSQIQRQALPDRRLRVGEVYREALWDAWELWNEIEGAGFAHTEVTAERRRELIEEVDRNVARQRDRHDLPEAAEALRLWARLMLAQADGAELDRFVEATPDPVDPMPRLYRARWNLKRYFDGFHMPAGPLWGAEDGPDPPAWEETEEMKARREAAKADLEWVGRMESVGELRWARWLEHVRGGLLTLLRAMKAHMEQGRDAARESYREAAQTMAKASEEPAGGRLCIELTWLEGLSWAMAAEHERGIDRLGAAISAIPSWGRMYEWRAGAYQLAGSPFYDAALADYDTALARNPDDWRAHGNRGLLLRELGRWAEAAAAFDAAYRIVGDRCPPLKDWLDDSRRRAASSDP